MRSLRMGSLTSTEMDELLYHHYVGRIACHNQNKVYVVPIGYVYDGQYLYSHSREGLKIELMRAYPHICFEVDEVESLNNWKSVIIQGKFQELIGERARKAMGILADRLLPKPTSASSDTFGIGHFHQHQQSPLHSVIFRIQINEMSGRFERHG